jgi:ArsR family transcriptional regulator
MNARLKETKPKAKPAGATCSGRCSKAAPLDKQVFRRQAQVLKALANESRLLIVDRLSRGECSVGELTELVGSDQSTVSKHLAVLRAHGIVRDHRRGNVVQYELMTPCVVTFFACASKVIEERE